MADMEYDVNVNETEAIFPEVDTDIDVPVTVGEDGITVLANSTDLNDVDIDAEVGNDELVNVEVSESTGGGTSDHRFLTHRDAANQHPISAITGLTERLASIESTFDTRLITAENGIVRLVMGQEQLVINVGQAQEDARTAAVMAVSAGTSAEIAQRAADAAIEANYKKYDEVTWTDAQILQKCTHGTTLTLPRHQVQPGDTEYYYLGDVKRGDIIVINVKKADHNNDLAKLLVEADDDYEQGEAVTGKVVSWDDNILAHFWNDSAGAHVTSVGGYRADLDGTGVKFYDNLGTQRAQFGSNGSVIGNPSGERFVQTATALQAYDSNGKYFEVTRNGMSYGNGTLVATAQSVVDAVGTANDYTDLQLVGPMRFMTSVGAVDGDGNYTLINGGAIKTGTLSANAITTGTLDASQVNVTNLNANNITSGTINAENVNIENLKVLGKTTGENVYIDSDSVDIRTGSTVDASFTATEILLCRGKGRIEYDDDRGSLCIVPSATQQVYLAMQNNPYGTSYQSEVWLNRGDCGMYTVDLSTATLAAVECSANGTVELKGQNGVKFTGNTTFNYNGQTCTVRPQASNGWLYCDKGFYSGSELRWQSTPSTGGTSQGQLYCKSSSITGYYVALGSSSKYLKHDIEDIKDINVYGLYDLPVRQFHWNEDMDETDELVCGFIADEVAEHFPQGAIYRDSYRDGKDPADWDDRQILPAMLKLIQDQHKEIEELKLRLNVIVA